MKNKTLTPFIDVVSRMNERPFCITQLIRKVRPYYKTVRHQNPKVFSLVAKDGTGAVKLHVSQENGKSFIDVRWSARFGETVTFGLFADSNKHLLEKLLKHKLL